MNKTYPVKYGMAALLWVSNFALGAWLGELSSPRVIPIPKEEHGYSNFETTVIGSQLELDMFLEKTSHSQNMAWNNRTAFEKALAQAKVDFNRELLLLIRHTEGSGSVQINFLEPRLKNRRVICRIDRKEMEGGTAVMAYYAFALAIIKADVTEVEIQVSGRKASVLLLKNDAASNKELEATR